MRIVVFFLTLLIMGLSNTFGQTVSDSIIMKKVFGGYQFYQGEQRLNLSQVASKMKPNNLAYQQIKSAQSTNTLATIIGGVGGFMVGWPIGTAIGGGKPNWTMAGVGAGLILVSIPISKSYNKKAIKAVETHNSGLQTSSFWDKNELKLSLTGNGIGLTMNF